MNKIDEEVFLKMKELIKDHTDTNLLKDVRKENPNIFDAALLDCMRETLDELKKIK